MPTEKVTRKARRKNRVAGKTVRKEILRELNEVICRLKQQYILFNNETQPDLIEECIYNINSLQARYTYLLKQAKEMGLENLAVFTPMSGARH